MPDAPTRAARLAQLDAQLARDADAIAARYARASLLRESGRTEEAKRDYLALLQRAPTHFGALNDFGTMLLATGYRDAARTVFEQAVRQHPEQPNGHVNLANLLFRTDELAPARTHFEAALRLDPDHVHAHRGLANLLAELGDEAAAQAHRDRGFRGHALTTLPYYGDGPPVAVLLFVSALGGNIPTAALLDERIFLTHVLVAEYADAQAALPPHAVVFNSIGDADLCEHGLAAAQAILARTPRPVINRPAAVRATGRLANAQRLHGLPDLVVPHVASLKRDQLAAASLRFPLLLRTPGFHTGRHFVRVEDARDLATALRELPGDDVWTIEPLDARGADGAFRKYRVMLVDGRLYPLHLAISPHWKVHYYTADMAADMADAHAHRREEEAFLADMPGVLGARAMSALARVAAALELDYGGIDFALGPSGEVLFFEANATMVVTPPTDDPKWAYRRPAVERVIAAVHQMLVARAPGAGALPPGHV
jgi:tetratricopeptide (TPR) repeat protein